jgi:hypothetical protein
MAQHNPYIDLQITFVYTITFDIFFKYMYNKGKEPFCLKRTYFFDSKLSLLNKYNYIRQTEES